MNNIIERLKAPFPPSAISWRVGSTTKDKTKGMALAYIDARDVMNRLDEVCGAEGWQCTYPHANGKTICSIGIKFGNEWVWKADGAGDSDVEAEKGAISDAFKRAAVKWGIGRYLYDMDSPWLEIEGFGNSYKFTKASLDTLANKQAPKQPPKPFDWAGWCAAYRDEVKAATSLEAIDAIVFKNKEKMGELATASPKTNAKLYAEIQACRSKFSPTKEAAE